MWHSILAVTVLGAAAAANPATPAVGASLSTSGNVWTNSVVLPSGSTVHPGDRISTDGAGAAVISSPQTGRIEIRNDTEVTLRADHVVLHKGVVATELAAIRVGDVRVQAKEAGGGALVVVSRRDGWLLVAAHRGDAVITSASGVPLAVPAGSYAMNAAQEKKEDPDKEDEKESDEDKANKGGDAKKAAGAAAGAGAVGAAAGAGAGGGATGAGAAGAAGAGAKAAATGWTIGGLSHAASVAVVGSVGAAAVGGTIAGVALAEESPSPSQ